MSPDLESPNERYKVGRVLSKYDLLELHEDLPKLWRGEAGQSVSLRDLAEKINIAILRRAMEAADNDPLEGEAENAYRLLTDDAVSGGVRTQQENRLQRLGIEIEQVQNDFVTHQAVYSYLRDGLGVSKETTTDQDPVEKHEQRIQRLRSRTTAVIENTLSELQRNGNLSLGRFDVIVDLQVYCQDCGTHHELINLLRNGECQCD